MQKPAHPARQTDISLLRILATLSVVFLHTNSALLDRPDLYALNPQQTLLLTLGKQCMNWAVPVFLMLTGALLLDPRRQLTFRLCAGKYARRALLALFVFGVPFSILEQVMNTRMLTFSMLPQAFLQVISGDSWAHLWYLYTLIGLYLLLPVFKRFTDAASRDELGSILLVLFLFQFLLPPLRTLFDLQIAFEIPVAGTAPFYLLMGRFLYDRLPACLQSRRRNLLLLLTTFACTLLVLLVFRTEAYLEYLTPVYAVLIFCLFRGLHPDERRTGLLWAIDRLCFGVYLVHPVFINFVYKFLKVTPLSFSAYPLMVFVFFSAFCVLAFLASKALTMIPPLKKHVL